MVQYRYARGNQNAIVDIRTTSTGEIEDKYTCLSCDAPLIPVRGDQREWHFRHKVDVSCNPETYLHIAAKELFRRTYEECVKNAVPFILELRVPVHCSNEYQFPESCQLGTDLQSYDITGLFGQVLVENRYGEVVPDILLKGNGDAVILFEVFVTHACSDAKIATKRRIIEWRVKTEADLSMLSDCKLSEESPSLKFYNFKAKTKHSPCDRSMCWNKPGLAVRFQVRASGKTHVAWPGESASKGSDVVWQKKVLAFNHNAIRIASEEARAAGIKVESCYLCWYAGPNWGYRHGPPSSGKSNVPIWCERKKTLCGANRARKCDLYAPRR